MCEKLLKINKNWQKMKKTHLSFRAKRFRRLMRREYEKAGSIKFQDKTTHLMAQNPNIFTIFRAITYFHLTANSKASSLYHKSFFK